MSEVVAEGPDRTHCDCGRQLPPKPGRGEVDLGDWACTWCERNYCDVCGTRLDDRDECPNGVIE